MVASRSDNEASARGPLELARESWPSQNWNTELGRTDGRAKGIFAAAATAAATIACIRLIATHAGRGATLNRPPTRTMGIERPIRRSVSHMHIGSSSERRASRLSFGRLEWRRRQSTPLVSLRTGYRRQTELA